MNHSPIIFDTIEPVRRSFVSTRHRSTDIDTSREAAKNAASAYASQVRTTIRKTLAESGMMTAREISNATGIDYYVIQRRISETGGIQRTEFRRDGAACWRISV